MNEILNEVHNRNRDRLALSVFITHLRRILLVPVNNILVSQYHNVTLTIAMLQHVTDQSVTDIHAFTVYKRQSRLRRVETNHFPKIRFSKNPEIRCVFMEYRYIFPSLSASRIFLMI